jgi:hypothetical protein
MERSLVKVQRFAVLGKPMMLHGDASEIGSGAHNLDEDGSLQISGCNAHGGRTAVNLTEAADVGENQAAKIGAMRIRGESIC